MGWIGFALLKRAWLACFRRPSVLHSRLHQLQNFAVGCCPRRPSFWKASARRLSRVNSIARVDGDPMAGLNGLGGDGSPNFDALGILYIVIAVFWTILIFCSLLWLYSIRDTIAVRIRNFWLLASAVVMLNLYEIAVLIRYPMNGSFKCGVEFWIMSTLLPFGIALFQGESEPRLKVLAPAYSATCPLLNFDAASNIQLLSYYEEQQHLARFSFRPKGRKYSKFTVRGLIWRWKQLTTVEKTYASIFVGVNVQVWFPRTVTLNRTSTKVSCSSLSHLLFSSGLGHFIRTMDFSVLAATLRDVATLLNGTLHVAYRT